MENDKKKLKQCFFIDLGFTAFFCSVIHFCLCYRRDTDTAGGKCFKMIKNTLRPSVDDIDTNICIKHVCHYNNFSLDSGFG